MLVRLLSRGLDVVHDDVMHIPDIQPLCSTYILTYTPYTGICSVCNRIQYSYIKLHSLPLFKTPNLVIRQALSH